MVLKIITRSIVIFIIICLILAYSPIFLDVNPVSYNVSVPDAYKGSLAINNRLDSVERLFEDEVKRPESLAVLNRVIYTGVSDGRILKVKGNRVATVAQIGNKCDGPWEEHICGRVLGLEFDQKNQLYAMDAYYGLHQVDITTGKVIPLITASTLIEGKQLIFGNDLTFDEDGIIYFTQSSTRWHIKSVLYSVLEHDNTGRVIKFNPHTKEIKVLLDGLYFPNGIILSHDKKSLLIAETNKNRILRYDLNQQSEKKFDVFMESLPGQPDNIQYSSRKGYWIPFTSGKTTSTLTLQDYSASFPLARKIMARMLHAIGSVLEYFAQFTSSYIFKTISFEIKNGRVLIHTIPVHGLIIEVDQNGKIIQSLHSPGGKIGFISEALEIENNLFLGSWHNNFLGMIKLN